MFPSSPELQKMIELIEAQDYASVEDYTYELLDSVSEENLIVDVWIADSRRMVIRFGLSILYCDPISITNPNEIMGWLHRASDFVEFLLCVETNYGLEGWANIFNSLAEKHYIDTVLEFNLMEFFNDMLLTPTPHVPKDMTLDDFLKNDNMFAVVDIPDLEQAWTDMVKSGEMFSKDFENDWE